ncbi:uncharacterized protein LOC134838745 [Symsagittifera roscoffensis]|uniref:uncharacterized protein LOC134838745 n=1 Tax=Symsagittifera roscoffensis TaxID=84072 RepID=UPI00307C8D4A
MSKKFGTASLKTPRKFLAGKKKELSSVIKTVLPAGMAAPAPPLGPMLGQRGIPITSFCADFNMKTAHFRQGIPLDVAINIKKDRSFTLDINVPSEEWLILSACGATEPIRRPSKRQPGVDQPPTGAVSLKHIYHIAATRQMHEQFKYHNLQELSQLVAYKCKELNVHVLDQVDQQTADYYLNWRQTWETEEDRLIQAEQEALESMRK